MPVAYVHDPLEDNEHAHEFPDDWIWGGVEEMDFRADPRWKPTTYTYYDANPTVVLWVTQFPMCDDEALDYFSNVAKIAGANPKWVAATRPGGAVEMLRTTYDAATDGLVDQ